MEREGDIGGARNRPTQEEMELERWIEVETGGERGRDREG